MIFRHADWPHGMICERCERPFAEGESVYSTPVGILPTGIPLVMPLCPACLGEDDPCSGLDRDTAGFDRNQVERVNAIGFIVDFSIEV